MKYILISLFSILIIFDYTNAFNCNVFPILKKIFSKHDNLNKNYTTHPPILKNYTTFKIYFDKKAENIVGPRKKNIYNKK